MDELVGDISRECVEAGLGEGFEELQVSAGVFLDMWQAFVSQGHISFPCETEADGTKRLVERLEEIERGTCLDRYRQLGGFRDCLGGILYSLNEVEALYREWVEPHAGRSVARRWLHQYALNLLADLRNARLDIELVLGPLTAAQYSCRGRTGSG